MINLNKNHLDELIKTAGMLGLEKKDIVYLGRIAPNKKIKYVNVAPMDSYNNSVGLYGTVSIKDILTK